MRHVHLVAAGLVGFFAAAGAQASPTIFWANDPVGPNNAVLVLGDDLAYARVTIENLGDGSGPRQDAKIEQVGPGSLKFIVPATMKAGAYRYVLQTPTGAATGELNLPTIYWAQGDQGQAATPGGWVRILGRNIARGAGARLTLTARDGGRLVLKPATAGLWDARFPLPAALAAGDYSLSLTNGDGGKQGWRAAGQVRVVAARPRPSLVIDVRQAGAAGDGAKDDAPTIAAALQRAAAQGGGTVYLPRGYYRLGSALVVPPGVTLKGEDRRLTTLVFTDFQSPPPVLIQLGSDTAIEDFTLNAGRYVHAISGGFPLAPGEPDGNDIAIRRVIIRASVFRGRLTPNETADRLKDMLTVSSGGGDSIRLAGRNLVIEDADVLGSGRSLFLLRPIGARIARNRLENGRYGWISITGADGVIFEDNTIEGADLQSTGGGVNTLGEVASRNVLIRNNTYERLLGWDAEALTTDGPGGFYYGPARSQDPSTILVTDAVTGSRLARAEGAGVFVTAGPGAGQYARVTKVSGQSVALDRPLAVRLAADSVVTIAPFQANYLIVGNRFADASVAAQIYGGSLDDVIAGNTSARTGGYRDLGLVYGGGVQPSWRTQVLYNEVTQSGADAPAAITLWGRQVAPSLTPLNVGAVVRGNKLHGNAFIEVKGLRADHPGLSDAIIEDNTIEKSERGVFVDGGTVRVLVRRNELVP